MIWYDTIWYDIWNDMMWYVMICYAMLCYAMIWYDMIWYDMTWYDMIRYDMIWYDMIWYDMIYVMQLAFLRSFFFFFFFAQGIICKVGLPHKDHPYCRAVRSKTLNATKNIYKLGHVKLENMKQPLPFPVTDIPARYLVGLHYKDPFTRQWMALYVDMLRKNLQRILKFPATQRKEFTEIGQYEDVYYEFLNAMKTDPVVGRIWLVVLTLQG